MFIFHKIVILLSIKSWYHDKQKKIMRMIAFYSSLKYKNIRY